MEINRKMRVTLAVRQDWGVREIQIDNHPSGKESTDQIGAWAIPTNLPSLEWVEVV